MGIPRLTRLLRPYADSKPLKEQEVVLDGPAFCYHINHICLSTRKSARNPLEAAVSYKELGTVAISWLDNLRISGVIVRQIYFDGFLPASKYETRILRVIANTQKLVLYHNTYSITPCLSRPREAEPTPELFAHHSVQDALMQLPPAPFLVPAIIEILQSSENYAGITKVVPAEADVYCADAIKHAGGIVITGDSDLLVYGTGSQGRVIFFRDIEMKDIDKSLSAPVYNPTQIAQELGLLDIQPLAFEMTLDNRSSLVELVERAKVGESIEIQQEQWVSFQAEYISKRSIPNSSNDTLATSAVLQRLDPRISEFVLQFPFIAKIAGQTPSDSNCVPRHVFLPFLHDCPARTNAWEISRAVRQLAYGLINIIAPENEQLMTVFEHKRQERKSGGRELQIPNSAQLAEECEALGNLLDELEKKLALSRKADLWTAVAVYQDIQWSHEHSRASLEQLVRPQVMQLEDKIHKNLSWEIVQFHAQIQGSYYSFRMLKQLMGVLMSHTAASTLPSSILRLHERLKSLPPLSEIKDLSHAISMIKMIRNKDISKTAHQILGINVTEISATPKTSHREAKKKRKEERKQSGPEKGPKASSNIFELLADE